MSLASFETTPPFVKAPTGTSDVTSGMQRATVNGIIGRLATTAGLPAPGAIIKGNVVANYFNSVVPPH